MRNGYDFWSLTNYFRQHARGVVPDGQYEQQEWRGDRAVELLKIHRHAVIMGALITASQQPTITTWITVINCCTHQIQFYLVMMAACSSNGISFSLFHIDDILSG